MSEGTNTNKFIGSEEEILQDGIEKGENIIEMQEAQEDVSNQVLQILKLPSLKIQQDIPIENGGIQVKNLPNGMGKMLVNAKGEEITSDKYLFDDFNFEYFEKYGFIIAQESDRGMMLLNKNGMNIFGDDFYGFDFKLFKEHGLILAREKGLKQVILNNELERVGKDAGGKEYLDEFNFDYLQQTGIIIGKKSMEGYVILDNKGIQLSPDREYFTGKLNFDYLQQTGAIIAYEKGQGYFLIDKNGTQISQKNTFYERISYNGEENNFYYKAMFGIARKVPLEKK